MPWSGDFYAHHDAWELDNRDSREHVEDYSSPSYKYQFDSEEELIKSHVFQKCLSQALAFKDREIDSLRNELLKQYWINYDNQRNRV